MDMVQTKVGIDGNRRAEERDGGLATAGGGGLDSGGCGRA